MYCSQDPANKSTRHPKSAGGCSQLRTYKSVEAGPETRHLEFIDKGFKILRKNMLRKMEKMWEKCRRRKTSCKSSNQLKKGHVAFKGPNSKTDDFSKETTEAKKNNFWHPKDWMGVGLWTASVKFNDLRKKFFGNAENWRCVPTEV